MIFLLLNLLNSLRIPAVLTGLMMTHKISILYKMVRRGAIVLIRYPFTDLKGSKVRPAVIITPNKMIPKLNDVLCLFISSNISSEILKSDFVILKIYNILGQQIQTLVNKFQTTGNYTVNFKAKNLSNGIYFYKIQVGNDYIDTKKMLLIR